MHNTYRTDLAHIHDAGFGDFARSAATFLMERLKSHGIQDGTVVDLGCGSGITARLLCDAGFSVQVLDRYGPQALLPGLVGFLAEKTPDE